MQGTPLGHLSMGRVKTTRHNYEILHSLLRFRAHMSSLPAYNLVSWRCPSKCPPLQPPSHPAQLLPKCPLLREMDHESPTAQITALASAGQFHRGFIHFRRRLVHGRVTRLPMSLHSTSLHETQHHERRRRRRRTCPDLSHGQRLPTVQKRSRMTSCASSAAVPSFVHRRMIASANSHCWLCSQHRNHIAHVIAFP